MKLTKQIFSLLLIVNCCLCARTAQAVAIDDEAPQFSLKSLTHKSLQNEQQVALSQFKGKVVYLDFWASWCGPCRQSFPFLEQLKQQYHQEDFEVVSVNLDEDPRLATDFLEQFPTHFIHLRGFNTDIAEKYAIEAMPTAFFIDANGRVRLIHKGFNPNHKAFIKAVLEKLIAEN